MSACTLLSEFAARLRRFILLWSSPSKAFSADPHGESTSFSELALQLFALQHTANPVFRAFCDRRGANPGTVIDWTSIPGVPATAFKEFEITCLPAASRTAVFLSSGTTAQERSRHFHSPESLEVYKCSLWPWFARHVAPELLSELRTARGTVRPRSLNNQQHIERASECAPCVANHNDTESERRLDLMFLTPSAAEAPHSSLAYMFEVIRREWRCDPDVFVGTASQVGDWELDADRAVAALARSVSESRPLLILGPAFSFVHLLDYVADRHLTLTLPPGSRVMETGGYKGRSRELPKAELHLRIRETLGIAGSHIISEYGMSELGSQAYDGRIPVPQTATLDAGRVFHFPPWARAKVISPETGREVRDDETGLIRVYDLANVFSVMAIQTEDLGIRRADGFELLGRASPSEARGCSLMLP